MPRTRTSLVALALCAIPLSALTACSSSSSPTASSSSGSQSSGASSNSGSSSSSVARPTDVCGLLSVAEISSTFGMSFGNPYSSDGSCDYTGDHTNLDVMLVPSNIDWRDSITIAKVQYGTLTSISGVGDQAVEASNFLEFRKGDVIFTLDDPDADGSYGAQYIAAAKIIVSHLG